MEERTANEGAGGEGDEWQGDPLERGFLKEEHDASHQPMALITRPLETIHARVVIRRGSYAGRYACS